MTDEFDQDTGEIIETPRSPMVQPQMRPLASVDVTEVCTALAKAQGEFDAPKRTKEAKISGTTRQGLDYSYAYKYAPLEEIIRAVQKPMAEAGLSRQQYLVSRGGQWFVRTIIWHMSGQWISSDYPVFPEAMTGPKFAAAVTYAKRQGLSLAVCLAPEDDLDAPDTEVAQTTERPTTKGATRTARPTPPPVASPAANRETASAGSRQGDVTAATESRGPSATGNGRDSAPLSPRKLMWVKSKFSEQSCEINPGLVPGGWSEWERLYLMFVANAENEEQIEKLRRDNEEHLKAFRAAHKEDVWIAFSTEIAANIKRLRGQDAVTPGETQGVLMG